MSEAKHTPTPWGWYAEDSSMVILCGHNQSGDLDPMEQHVASITPCQACQDRTKDKNVWTWGRCTTPTEANAAFIVRAVNAHDELAEALRGLIEACTAEFNEKGAGGYALARLSDARTALAKAESS